MFLFFQTYILNSGLLWFMILEYIITWHSEIKCSKYNLAKVYSVFYTAVMSRLRKSVFFLTVKNNCQLLTTFGWIKSAHWFWRMINHIESGQVPIFHALVQKSWWFIKSRVNFSDFFWLRKQKIASSNQMWKIKKKWGSDIYVVVKN